MVTKSGVPSNKIFVGISSYGRSFKMAKAGCTGTMCEYLGDYSNSPAAKGECTGTAGYLADAEIRQIRDTADWSGISYYEYYDEASDSDVLVYDNVEWVAWMDVQTKQRRIDWYKGLVGHTNCLWAKNVNS